LTLKIKDRDIQSVIAKKEAYKPLFYLQFSQEEALIVIYSEYVKYILP